MPRYDARDAGRAKADWAEVENLLRQS